MWQTLLRIPMGRPHHLFRHRGFVGAPKAARAVGAAVGKNPISFVVPCHRVIGKAGETHRLPLGPDAQARHARLEPGRWRRSGPRVPDKRRRSRSADPGPRSAARQKEPGSRVSLRSPGHEVAADCSSPDTSLSNRDERTETKAPPRHAGRARWQGLA